MLRQAKAQYSADWETNMGRMTRLRLIEVGLALVLTVVACFFVALAVWAEDRSEIAISGAWARPTIGEGRATAAYMTIENAGSADDVLVSAKSPQAARVEIHETKMTDDGVMTMRPLASGLTVPAGGAASLKPGGAHMMVMGLEGKLTEGGVLPLTLEFKNAGAIDVSVPVGQGRAGGAQTNGTASEPEHHSHP